MSTSNIVIVLQARLSSSRLPCKVILPINGIPIVVLAAKRAANTGRKVIVLTSDDYSDDPLVSVLNDWNIEYKRGSLQNVLERFVSNLSNYPDDSIIVRLTSDNIIPDGKLIDEMLEYFNSQKLNYLSCSIHESGLPYGVSAEVIRLKHLRESLSICTTPENLEHVTPYIISKFGQASFDKYQYLNKSTYRCTIDNIEDYIYMHQVFQKVENPISIEFLDIINNLPVPQNNKLGKQRKNSKIVLGTAQFGMEYGINNSIGKPNQLEINEMVEIAIKNGVNNIDTANAYGKSEEVLGIALSKCKAQQELNIITKLSPVIPSVVESNISAVDTYVEASVFASIVKLKRNPLDTLLLHRATHLKMYDGYIWNKLLQYKSRGLIKNLGVSVQSPAEALMVLDNSQVSHIQLPFNILDYRWDNVICKIKEIKKERSLIVHVRSVFLQGLLLTDNIYKWKKANVSDNFIVNTWINEAVNVCHCINRANLCLAFVNSLEWIDGIVIGLETSEQLLENIRLLDNVQLTDDNLSWIYKTRPILNDMSLNPSQWSIG